MKEKAFRFATSSQCAINLYASSTSLFCEYVYVFFLDITALIIILMKINGKRKHGR